MTLADDRLVRLKDRAGSFISVVAPALVSRTLFPQPVRAFGAMNTARELPEPSIVIRVAEDDMLIRMMAVDALTDVGFVVIEAESSNDALNMLTAQAYGIRALFTDIHMPGGMNGLELAHHVYSHWPWIALLVASGKARPAPEDMPIGSRFLSKPYDLDHAVQHVRELIDAT